MKLVEPAGAIFSRTPIVAQVTRALAATQRHNWIASIQGPPGIGKTTAALKYADENPRRVWYYASRPDTSAKGPLFRELADRLTGFRDAHTRDNVRSLSKTAEELSAAFGPILLIIDEAQTLNPDALETLRAIYDEGSLCLAFVGNHTFTDRFRHERGSLVASPQFLSRIDLTLPLERASAEDVAALAAAHGIPDALVDRLAKAARGACGLRIVKRVDDLARSTSAPRPPTRHDYESAFNFLCG
jgi:DNA transposition AAA+ family ATPase